MAQWMLLAVCTICNSATYAYFHRIGKATGGVGVAVFVHYENMCISAWLLVRDFLLAVIYFSLAALYPI